MSTALSPIEQLAPITPTVSLGVPVQSLSRQQKAAIIVRILLSQGAELPIAEFPESLQHSLTRNMGSLKSISRETMDDVCEEFLSELDHVGMFFPGGVDGALKVLENTLSPSMVTRLRREAGGIFYGDPWEKIIDLSIELLQPVLEEESIEICAVVLSKLSVAKAAELLGLLPGERARRITYAISQTAAISPEAVRRIGVALATQLNNQPPVAFAKDPVERVGAILNFSPASTRDEVLDGLDEDDATFAAEVRKSIFTFGNIKSRIAPRDVPKFIRGIDQPDLVSALVYATQEGDAETPEYILENMSQRMATTLREEMAEVSKIKPKDGETAQGAVVAAIRELEAKGELFFIADDE